MINQEKIDAYREMAKNASENSMEAQIRANLESTCDKFAGHEDRLEDCMEYLTECARGILNGKNGEVDDDTCYRICRDYFNDEIWAKEDEAKTAKEAKRKADKEKLDKIRSEKKAKKPVKMTASQVEKESLGKEKQHIEKLKEKHGCKPAEPEKTFQVCPECGKECINLFKGVCLVCNYKMRKAKEAKMEKIVAERETIASKNRAIIEENNKKLGIGMAQPIDMFAEAV